MGTFSDIPQGSTGLLLWNTHDAYDIDESEFKPMRLELAKVTNIENNGQLVRIQRVPIMQFEYGRSYPISHIDGTFQPGLINDRRSTNIPVCIPASFIGLK